MDLYDLDLGRFGAPGYTLSDRLDMTGHESGRVDPHINTDLINPAGEVGPIGGIPQKLIAAKAAGATYFLTPKANCAEAVANEKAGMPLVQVGSLDEALTALADIRAGKKPTLCPGAH